MFQWSRVLINILIKYRVKIDTLDASTYVSFMLGTVCFILYNAMSQASTHLLWPCFKAEHFIIAIVLNSTHSYCRCIDIIYLITKYVLIESKAFILKLWISCIIKTVCCYRFVPKPLYLAVLDPIYLDIIYMVAYFLYLPLKCITIEFQNLLKPSRPPFPQGFSLFRYIEKRAD